MRHVVRHEQPYAERAALFATVALALSGLATQGCETPVEAPAAGEIRICAEVTDDFRCRLPTKTVAPGLPYAFLAEGAPIPSRDVVVQLVRLDAGRPSTIARQRDRVAADANVYTNTLSVAQPGIYRLELWSGRDVYAAVQFEATRRASPGSKTTPRGEREPAAGDPSRPRTEVRCATACEGVAAELARLHQRCVDDPLSEVRQAMSGAMVALGCCGWASGVYERSCALAGPMRECADGWTMQCTQRAR